MDSEQTIRCGECGQPLTSWAEPHSVADCRWWIATQPARDVLVGLSGLQADLDRIVQADGV